MSITTTPVLSVVDILSVADALRMVTREARIEWATPAGYIHTGTLRHLTDCNRSAYRPGPGQDVLETHVRITLDVSGADCWMPLTELARLLWTGYAAESR